MVETILLVISSLCLICASWNMYQVYMLLESLKKSLQETIDSTKN